MATTKRVKVNTRPVAANYADADETIIEFTSPDGLGGLISFRPVAGGLMLVHLYRLDPQVIVSVQETQS